jgi:type I restriction enzyme R subunit
LDPFDLILHIAYDQRPLTRKERAEKVRKRNYFAKYGDVARAVLQGLLDKYQDEGVIDLDDPNVLRIAPFAQIGTPVQLVRAFGGKDQFVAAVHEVQATLYREIA